MSLTSTFPAGASTVKAGCPRYPSARNASVALMLSARRTGTAHAASPTASMMPSAASNSSHEQRWTRKHLWPEPADSCRAVAQERTP